MQAPLKRLPAHGPCRGRRAAPSLGRKRRWLLRHALGLALGLAFALATASADAGEPPEPPARPTPVPEIVPPRLVAGGDVPYPQDGSGDHTVVLELVVLKDGSVQDARVVHGDAPFAGAALAAARGFKFQPALRGAEPVTARIRLAVGFSAPPAPVAVPPSPSQAPTRRAGAASVAPVEQVEVRGARKEAGQTTLGLAEIRDIPGAFGDAFRAVETLPGVVPVASGLPFFFVRGAPPGNTGYYLDGVRVPLLYHLALGPAVIHPGLVDHVDFWGGAPPARFGRFAGGFISGETRAPAPRVHAEGNVRLFDAGALAETPFADGRGTFLAAGRVSYTALLFSAIVPDTRLDYWDYQARATYALTPKDQVSVFAFGSHDFLGEVARVRSADGTSSSQTRTVFATEFHRLDLRYERRIEGGRTRLAVTAGLDESNLGVDAVSRDRMLAARWDLEKRLTPELTVRAGADVTLDRFDLLDDPTRSRDTSAFASIFPPRTDLGLGVRADAVWRVAPRVEIVPGARLDLFGSFLTRPPRDGSPASTVVPALDPRLAVRVKVTPALTYVSTLGLQHQTPAFIVPVPGLQVGRLSEGLQSAVHASQGAEISLPLQLTLSPTLFVANTFGLTDATATCGGEIEIDDARCVRRVSGQTYGLELTARRAFSERLTGFVTYTLSRSTRLTRPLVLRSDGPLTSFGPTAKLGEPQRIPGEFDRAHVLNVAASYALGRGWRVGARLYFYTGRPYSETVSGVPLPPYNAYRFPDFYRFDFRVEKRWTFAKTGFVALVAEWLNATLRKEALTIDCDRRGSLTRCTPDEIGPITIPSLGVEGGF